MRSPPNVPPTRRGPRLLALAAALALGRAIVGCGEPESGHPGEPGELGELGELGEPGPPGGASSAGAPADPAHAPGSLAPPWTSPPTDHGEACVDCHEGIVRDWRTTTMARALGPVGSDEVAGLAGLGAVDGAGYRYAFEHREGARAGAPARIVETRADAEAHRIAVELAYAIGAGSVDRSYVARIASFDWFAPLEVLSTDAGRFAALAPGHSIRPGSRFTVGITDECLGCHTDAPPPERFPKNQAPPVAWEPRGIGCGACHAGADAHAAWQVADLSGEETAGRDPIGRAGSLSRKQRMSICAACHLQGDARIALGPGAVGPPRPGVDVLERRALFVAREPGPEVGFVSQTERLVLSACYLRSDSMTCETCHDPHRALSRDGERARTRAACGSCHPTAGAQHGQSSAGACSRMDDTPPPGLPEPPDGASPDCVACHMRVTPVFDVAHVEIHDHWIRAEPDPPSAPGPLRVPESAEGDWRRFTWPGEPRPEHVDDPGLWMMALDHHGHTERALARVDEPPGPTVARLPMYHHVRGSLLERFERFADAIAAYERALALDPDLAPSAINLALLLGQTGRPDAGVALLDRVLERHPQAVGALRNRAALRYLQGDAAGFERDLVRAFEVQPTGELARLVADWKRGLGDAAGSARWMDRARGLDPAGSPGSNTRSQ